MNKNSQTGGRYTYHNPHRQWRSIKVAKLLNPAEHCHYHVEYHGARIGPNLMWLAGVDLDKNRRAISSAVNL